MKKVFLILPMLLGLSAFAASGPGNNCSETELRDVRVRSAELCGTKILDVYKCDTTRFFGQDFDSSGIAHALEKHVTYVITPWDDRALDCEPYEHEVPKTCTVQREVCVKR